MTASVNEESRVESSNFYNVYTVAILCRSINYCSSIVKHLAILPIRFFPRHSGEDITSGPRKWTKVTRPSLAVGEGCGLWTRLSDDLNSKWRLLLAENELSRVSLLSIGN